MTEKKCPKCGMPIDGGEACLVTYACGSSEILGEPHSFIRNDTCLIKSLTAQLAAEKEKVRIAKEALRPFAEMAPLKCRGQKDDEILFCVCGTETLRVGDFRRALEAIEN